MVGTRRGLMKIVIVAFERESLELRRLLRDK